MIARLKGLLDYTDDGRVVLDVGGVGYLVFCSNRTIADLAAPGSPVTLEIETQVREDQIALYGFRDVSERDWFRLLITVQGVGARVALAILLVLPPKDLARAIAAGDKALITRADGVGPKLATRILSELRDKAPAPETGHGFSAAGGATADDPAARTVEGDAVSALVNLGYGRSEAYGAVARAASRLGDGAGVELLIRDGLKELST